MKPSKGDEQESWGLLLGTSPPGLVCDLLIVVVMTQGSAGHTECWCTLLLELKKWPGPLMFPGYEKRQQPGLGKRRRHGSVKRKKHGLWLTSESLLGRSPGWQSLRNLGSN